MRTVKACWWALALVLAVASGAVAFRGLGVGTLVALAVPLAGIGAVLGLAWDAEVVTVRLPALGAVAGAAAALVVPGAGMLLGAAAGPVLVVVAATSPPLLGSRLVRRWRRGATAHLTEDARARRLRGEWEASGEVLARVSNLELLLEVVELRGHLLDLIAEQHHGTLPAYVWDAAAGPARQERHDPAAGDLGP